MRRGKWHAIDGGRTSVAGTNEGDQFVIRERQAEKRSAIASAIASAITLSDGVAERHDSARCWSGWAGIKISKCR